MASRFVKLLLFGSSYAPLGVIFAFLFWAQNEPVQALVAIAISAVCVGVFLYYFKVRVPSRSRSSIKVASFSRRDGDALSYVATYLIPFVTVPFFDKWQETVALLFFLLVLALIYINSDLIAVNPLLVMMRYHLYEITLVNGTSSCLFLSQDAMVTNIEISVFDISEGVYLQERKGD